MPNDRSKPEPETVAQQETGGGCQQEPCSPSSVRHGKVFFAYRGPLFGKRGRKYIPLKMASDDVDEMEKERDAMLDLIKHMDIHSNYTRCGYAKMDAAQRKLFDRISSGPFSWENA